MDFKEIGNNRKSYYGVCIRNKGRNIKNRQMLEANVMRALRKIVGKTKRIRRSRQIWDPCGIQTINEWVERRREWDGYLTRIDAWRLVKISRDIYLQEDDLQYALKEDGANLSLLKQVESPRT